MPQSSDSVQPRSTLAKSQLAEQGRVLPDCDRSAKNGTIGTVYLVGAGPGDPGLITLRGKQCLELANVVLFDGLANPQLLELAPQAEHVSVGKHGLSPIWNQHDIHAKLIELARQGKKVVRLKGGDPAVFARTAEELEVLAASQIPFEVVPGITAALAAASYVGIPITHRQHASAVAFITGQQQTRESPQAIDWHALARFPGTLVFYMGVTTVQEWTSNLMKAGKAADTPAAIVRRCSWSDQTVIRCELGAVAGALTPASKLRPPVIVIVGEVAALGEDFDWFTSRPLHGCGVLCTRPRAQSQELANLLAEAGAQVFHQPMLEIVPPRDTASLDRAIELLADSQSVDGITFSSANGVDGFVGRLFELGYDARRLAGCRLATVGPATAEALHAFGLRADVVPEGSASFSAAALLEELRDEVRDTHWIVTTTNRSRDTLTTGLAECGARVTEALSYETKPTANVSIGVESALKGGNIQLCTITSQAIAETSFELLTDYHSSVRPVSLSPAISDRLRQLGWPPIAEAREPSSASLVEACVAAHMQSISDC